MISPQAIDAVWLTCCGLSATLWALQTIWQRRIAKRAYLDSLWDQSQVIFQQAQNAYDRGDRNAYGFHVARFHEVEEAWREEAVRIGSLKAKETNPWPP